ncbi:hypothetical protein Mgra_00003811 [Meloidogyne graminicola]|uniref:Uncharacterized protein n=1 Tax=Meloidogyne graminicola TaxID=189291 RepID=A0A8S9ZTI0_9BILA|nr:hypothetical protein Mgra_00003811 [Meloidogyne graminicola]
MHFPTIFLIIFVLLLIAILGNCGRRRKDSIKIRSEFSSTRSNPLDEALESAEKKFKEVMGNLKNKTVKTAKSMVRSVSEVITKREDYKLKYEDILIQLKKLNNPEEISAKYEKISAEENRIRNRYSDHLNNILNYDFKQLIENLTEHLDKYKKKILKAIKTNFFNEGTDVEDEIITKIKKHIIKYSQDEEEAFIQINKIYNSTWQGCNAIIEINKEIRTKQDKINKRYDKYYNEYEIYLEQLNVANNKIKQKIFNDVFVYFNNINKEELCDVKGEHNYNINPEVAKKSHSWEKIVLKIKPVPEKEIKTQIKNLNKNINPIWEQIARKIICLKYIYEDLIEANKRCKNISSFINNHKQLQFEFSTEKTSSEVNDMGIRLNHLVHKPAIMYFIYLKKGTYDALSYTERDMMEELNQKTNELFKVWGGINKDFDYLMVKN